MVFPERFRGRPAVTTAGCGDSVRTDAGGERPTSLIRAGADGRAVIDLGACLFSPEEETGEADCGVHFTHDHQMSACSRQGLVTPTGEPERVWALDERMRSLFGRSLRLRSVAAGSCNGCESELAALGNVVFDMARFGIQFVASPRHADGIVITGVVNVNMRDALLRTYNAMPDPRLVIAVGACTASGGPFRSGPEVCGVPDEIPVDLWIPGCPPHPLTVLDGVLRLLGRIR
jgi:Ni,Fe-hydrogenase III small subunit